MTEDTISRRAAIREIMDDIKDTSLHDDPGIPEGYAEGYDEGIRNAAAIVLQMPSVDAVPVKRGKWKAVTEDGEEYKRICSCCGKEAPFDETERVYLIYPHCPWCGADMREEDGDG